MGVARETQDAGFAPGAPTDSNRLLKNASQAGISCRACEVRLEFSIRSEIQGDLAGCAPS